MVATRTRANYPDSLYNIHMVTEWQIDIMMSRSMGVVILHTTRAGTPDALDG